MSEEVTREFEREKWRDEYELRKREIEIKDRDSSRSRWSSPIVLAVLGAAIAALGNAAAIWLTGVEQRNLETTKAEQARALEEDRAEATRILEMIKTGNEPEKAAENLRFLLDAGLISNPDRSRRIQNFLARREPGKGPALPAAPALPATVSLEMLEQLRKSIVDLASKPPDPAIMKQMMQMMHEQEQEKAKAK